MKNILSYADFLKEGWLHKGGSMPYLQTPQKTKGWKMPSFRKLDNQVTPDTRKLLSMLQPYYHDVALFSWHPNIKRAQYSGYYHHSASEKPNNRNSREWIESNLTVMRSKENPNEERSFGDLDFLRKIVQSFDYMKYLGGSGDTQDGRNVAIAQLSFMVGDAEDFGRKVKAEKLTAGAYTFKDGEWEYVGAEEFDITPLLRAEALAEVSKIRDVLEASPEVEKTTVREEQDGQNFAIFAELQNGQTIKVTLQRSPEDKMEEVPYTYELYASKPIKNYTKTNVIEIENQKDLIVALVTGIVIKKTWNGLNPHKVQMIEPLYPEKYWKDAREGTLDVKKAAEEMRGKRVSQDIGIV
jgi:hypothetical protein